MGFSSSILRPMLPKGMEAAAHVTRDGVIKLSFTIEPELAPILMTLAKTILKASEQAHARLAVIRLEKKASRECADMARVHTRQLERLALTVYHRTKKVRLACKASGLTRTYLKHLLISTRVKTKEQKRVKRDALIIKACLRGENHAAIGAKLGLHQKSVTRLFNKSKQTALNI